MNGLHLPRLLRTTLAAAILSLAATASAHEPTGPNPPSEELPPQLADVGVVEHLGDRVPLDVELVDESGQKVRLDRYFGGQKPVFLNFVYHSCPTLCSMVQTAVTATLKDVPWDIGDKYDVLTVSIDPRDTAQIAAEKKQRWVGVYGRDPAKTAAGWHFLTGSKESVKRLTDAVGFKYSWDEKQQQFAHSAAVFVLTPDGKVARYLYGIEFPPTDVRLALAEAAQGRSSIGAVEHLLLYCYQYDPNARGYVLQAWKIMRLGAAGGAILLASFLGVLWLRERRKRPRTGAPHDIKTSIDRGALPPATPS